MHFVAGARAQGASSGTPTALSDVPGVVVVTGASRGIGAAIARLVAQRGYHVCVNYATDERAAAGVVTDITEHGGHAIAVQADVRRTADVDRLFRSVDERLGSLNALVNNAGVLGPQCRVDELSEERLNRILSTNVAGYFLCARQAVLRMSTLHGGSGGAIVNVSSAASRLGSPGEYVDYAASKGAVDTLTIGLALEVAAEGIRVNAVRPGFDLHRHPCQRRGPESCRATSGEPADEAWRPSRGSR